MLAGNISRFPQLMRGNPNIIKSCWRVHLATMILLSSHKRLQANRVPYIKDPPPNALVQTRVRCFCSYKGCGDFTIYFTWMQLPQYDAAHNLQRTAWRMHCDVGANKMCSFHMWTGKLVWMVNRLMACANLTTPYFFSQESYIILFHFEMSWDENCLKGGS